MTRSILGGVNMKKILCLLLAAVMAVSLISCGSSDAKSELERTLKAVKAGNIEYFENSEEELSEEDAEYYQLMIKNFDYKILSCEENEAGDAASAEVKFTNTDMKAVMTDFMSQALQLSMKNAFGDNPKSDDQLQKEIEQIFVDLLKSDDYQKVETTVTVKLTKEEDGWAIDFDDTVIDAILGGIDDFSF